MKSGFILLFTLLICTLTAQAQMDDKFYYPDKQWEAIDSVNYEEISLKVDKDTIHSILVKPDIPAKATILFFHGNGGNISKWLGHFTPLIKEGFQVGLLDYRGYGKSTGTPTHLNIAGDARLWIDTMLQREDVRNLPIIIYGASIGTQVATLMAKEYNDAISGLVVDGMMASFTDVALATSPAEYHEQIKAHVTSPYSARENLEHISGIKMLFIHSPQDFIPIVQAWEIYGNTSCQKRFWEYTGEHVRAPLLYPEEFVKHMNWMVECGITRL
jgi:predicted alpha/beta-fold hydrolase